MVYAGPIPKGSQTVTVGANLTIGLLGRALMDPNRGRLWPLCGPVMSVSEMGRGMRFDSANQAGRLMVEHELLGVDQRPDDILERFTFVFLSRDVTGCRRKFIRSRLPA